MKIIDPIEKQKEYNKWLREGRNQIQWQEIAKSSQRSTAPDVTIWTFYYQQRLILRIFKWRHDDNTYRLIAYQSKTQFKDWNYKGEIIFEGATLEEAKDFAQKAFAKWMEIQILADE